MAQAFFLQNVVVERAEIVNITVALYIFFIIVAGPHVIALFLLSIYSMTIYYDFYIHTVTAR